MGGKLDGEFIMLTTKLRPVNIYFLDLLTAVIFSN